MCKFVAWQCCQKAKGALEKCGICIVIPSKRNAASYFTLPIFFFLVVIPFILIVKLAFTSISLVWLVASAFSQLL